MTINDICYTPLDVSNAPDYSIDDVKTWITENTETLQQCVDDLCKRGLSGQKDVDKYPWRLVFAYWNEYGGWLNNFDKKFPELSRYMHEAFNLKEDELESILLLPMNNDITGYGFWHNHGDKAGYRMYLNNDVGSLFLRKTKKPYDSNHWVKIKECDETWNDSELERTEHECKLLSSNQCFYLNNFRSAHATYVEEQPKDLPRIAVIINPKEVPTDDSLVINSAKKYKDYAIMYYE